MPRLGLGIHEFVKTGAVCDRNSWITSLKLVMTVELGATVE
jgi:hypothetical protein